MIKGGDTMNYAVPSNRSFSTKGTVVRKKTMTESMRRKREFYDNHDISVRISPSGECILKATKKEDKND